MRPEDEPVHAVGNARQPSIKSIYSQWSCAMCILYSSLLISSREAADTNQCVMPHFGVIYKRVERLMTPSQWGVGGWEKGLIDFSSSSQAWPFYPAQDHHLAWHLHSSSETGTSLSVGTISHCFSLSESLKTRMPMGIARTPGVPMGVQLGFSIPLS